jgi:hypothetical protein
MRLVLLINIEFYNLFSKIKTILSNRFLIFVSVNRDLSTDSESNPIHLDVEDPIYVGLESSGINYPPSKKQDPEYYLRGKKDQDLTPIQRLYLTDHLLAKKDQETPQIVRRSENILDDSDETLQAYTILKRLSPIQRNYIADHLSSFVDSNLRIHQQ